MADRRSAPRAVDQPSPGYFLIREIRGGPFLPSRIARDASGWHAYINGKLCGQPNQDPLRAPGVMKIWHGGRDSTKAEYEQLLGALRSDPDHPAHKRRTRVDLAKLPPVF